MKRTENKILSAMNVFFFISLFSVVTLQAQNLDKAKKQPI